MRNKKACIPDVSKMFTNPGEAKQITYSAKVYPNGTIHLVPNGEVDVCEYINSFKDQTDMAYILKMIKQGDLSVLHRGQPIYGDFTEMPTNPHEMAQMMIDAEYEFNQLPLDKRMEFNNSYVSWLEAAREDPVKFKESFGKKEEESEVKVDAES